jgi:truncated hemoglobin YjbI
MVEELTTLFQQWLTAFEKTLSETGAEETVAALALARIESRIVAHRPKGRVGSW